ncbi:FixH family protein [soil metagenome]
MKPGAAWPIGIVAILAVFVGGNLFMMRIANDDPSMAIEPDYYRKAVGFDSTMAEERRSAALGWSAQTKIAGSDSAPGATVRVWLRDAAHQPVEGAKVTIVARFNARANDTIVDTLTERATGEYAAPLRVSHAGEWEVLVTAERGTSRFTASTRTDAPASAVIR